MNHCFETCGAGMKINVAVSDGNRILLLEHQCNGVIDVCTTTSLGIVVSKHACKIMPFFQNLILLQWAISS
jgi:hypothetical protein